MAGTSCSTRIEALRGRPLSDRAQEIGFRIGLAIVVMLMLFATWNDIVHLGASFAAEGRDAERDTKDTPRQNAEAAGVAGVCIGADVR